MCSIEILVANKIIIIHHPDSTVPEGEVPAETGEYKNKNSREESGLLTCINEL